jgi:cysteine sulfinate desulfinase/cysteine desulfurase-like protein
MKLSDEIIDKSIRISFSRDNTRADVDALVSALAELIENYPK